MAISMKDFAIVTTSQLPAEAYEAIVAAAVEQKIEAGKLRPLCQIDNVQDEGAKKYIYFTYDDLTAAYDRGEGADWQYDSAGATSSSADFVELAKGFKISWEADHLKKLNVRVAQTRACVDQIRDREDTKIAAVLTNATSSVTAAGVMSGTSADPVKDIRQAIRKCEALGYTPDTLLIEQVNLEELESIVASNTWYYLTEQVLKTRMTNFKGLNVITLKAALLTHGTSYVLKTGAQGSLQLGLAHDIRTKIFDDEDSHCTKVQVYERMCPVMIRPDAAAKITGW